MSWDLSQRACTLDKERNLNLVAVPFHDWNKCVQEGFRTRDAHLLEEFGRHPSIEKVLVVNRPLSPPEMLKKRIFQSHGTVRQVSSKIYTVDSVIPQIVQPVIQKRQWIPNAYGHDRTVKAVKTAIVSLGMDDYALWSNSPVHVPLVKRLSPLSFAFDMTDNLFKHADYRSLPHLEEYYDYCMAEAEVITANSLDNTQWLSNRRTDAVCIANGVSFERFDPSVSRNKPADLENMTAPIVGYAGKMQEMVDLDLLEQLAIAFPTVNFVFIGQILNADWMQPIWRHQNVHYLGDKHYDRLPDYLASFDICIIPYDMGRQHGGDPIKFYEYLAMGKPVVTTDIGGVSRFSGFPRVCVAHSIHEFVKGLNVFLEQYDQGISAAFAPIPNDVSWTYKADQIIRMFVTSLENAQ